ncbi:Na+/H+ antiporter NhaC family protein [candidate division KSB1 bacterium]|nr:Na+/H+ antiporter NhaC family protein [candidate division KSB1 bacterium]
MTISERKLEFHGGPAVSVLPIAVFLLSTIVLVLKGAPAVEGMILAAMLGISIGMIFAKDVAQYSEEVFSLMANRIATVAVVCWLWAGAFSGIMAASGLVEAIVWLGWKLNLQGEWFTVAVFVSASLFATSVGTGLGTVVGFTTVLYPAGIVLGANPAALMGAIFSGAALGDNLAPISDTTIVSAATQETDVGGVVRSRLKYVLIAAGISCVLFFIFGAGNTALSASEAQQLLAETADPRGLPMLIPAAIVFLVAFSGRHFLGALTAGIASAMIVGPVAGVFSLHEVFNITGNSVAGSAVSGAMSLVPISILTLLLVTAIGIMQASSFLERHITWLQATIAKSVTGTELAIVALISLTNICVSVNTVAMIAAGPLVNVLRKRFGLSPYRSANLMDAISCSFPYLLPYAATTVAAVAIQQEVAKRYGFVEILSYDQFAPFAFYCVLLFPLMIVAAVTGFGRKKG